MHLQNLARQGDQSAEAELADAPPLPRHAAYLWGYFQDLSQTRTSNGMGPSRLTRLEIQAWEKDEGIALERWERHAIMSVDRLWLAFTVDPDFDPTPPTDDHEGGA